MRPLLSVGWLGAVMAAVLGALLRMAGKLTHARSRLLGLSAMVIAVVSPPAVASAAGSIYWSNGGDYGNAISFASLDGASAGDLYTGGATVSNPWGVAIDAATGKLYWANRVTTNQISYVNLDDSGAGNLITAFTQTVGGRSGAMGVAIDPVAGKIYWTNSHYISYANLDGSGAGDLNTTGAIVSAPAGVAVDPVAGKIYWTNSADNTHPVSYAKLDGSGGGGNLNTTGATAWTPDGIAIDSATGKIYWANETTPAISYANADGSGGGGDLNTTGATAGPGAGVAIDPVAGKIYWGNYSGYRISYANLDGSGGGDVSTGTATVEGAGFPALLMAPAGAEAPSITSYGSSLNCSQGSWAPDALESFFYRAPQTFDYQWLHDGTAITGATNASYTPSTGGSYTCQVTAINHAGSTSQTSAAFLIPTPPLTPPGAVSSASGSSTDPGGTATATNAGTTVTASGVGAFTVARYASNPAGATSFSSTGEFFDVHVAAGSSFTSLTIADCSLNGGSSLYWWDGSGWLAVSPESYSAGPPSCVTAILSSSSSPTIAQLTATVFAVAKPTSATPPPPPPPSPPPPPPVAAKAKAKPTVSTGGASLVTATGAVLQAMVNPQGQATSYHLDYGTTTSYGSKAPVGDAAVGSDFTARRVSQAVSGLLPGRTYHYRIVASNATGTSYGADRTFTTAPQISGVRMTPAGFRALRSGPSVLLKGSKGTKVSYTLSDRGTMTFTIEQVLTGRRKGESCLPDTRARRKLPRCTRYVALKGSFKHTGKAGLNSFRFTGRLNGKTLKPGSYRLTATVRDSTGKPSAPARLTFTIRR